MYRTLKEKYGVLPEESIDSYAAGPPTTSEARALGLEPGSAVWHCQRTSFEVDGQVIEYTESTFRLDRFRFTTRRRAIHAGDP
jgi:GntR family transcriptional regulator